MAEYVRKVMKVRSGEIGRRLDQVLAEHFSDYSRSRVQQWVQGGLVRVDGETVRAASKLKSGQTIEVDVTIQPEGRVEAQDIPLSVIHQDEDVIVVDKPAGLVVHPAAGNPDGTLQNALLHHDPDLAAVPRGGIVHRLDKLTSGIMVVARNLRSHAALVTQLSQRTVSREYRALVAGEVRSAGTVDAPIGRHPRDRIKMAVVAGGKPAITHYRVLDRMVGVTLLGVNLETGRTHQIRVHMAHLGFPLLGDPVYGGRQRFPAGYGDLALNALRAFGRQALHARRLTFIHPRSKEHVTFEAPLPVDIASLLRVLRGDH